jgi:hypothetical protein
MKHCCEEQGYNCQQGRKCTRRVRAGQPVPDNVELWQRLDPVAEWEAEANRQFKSDMKSIIFIAACVLSFFLIVLWSTP